MGIGEVRSRPTTTPVLPVHDMAAVTAFYERLGFEIHLFYPSYALVEHSGRELFHLELNNDLDRSANRAAIFVRVANADEWHSAWREAGIDLGDIADRPWGMREFSLIDPSGNTLRVGCDT